MASGKKYAGLPDLDLSQEIYQTPALTDDASTIQTETLRTDSPTPSDEGGDERLVRQRLDTEAARRRFEPTLVSSRDVNFSDTVVTGARKSYRTKSRRRRRRDYDDGSGSESEEETLSSRLARLKREAEEVRLELAKKDEGEFKNTVEQQQASGTEEDGLEELTKLVQGLDTPKSNGTISKSEDQFLRSLATTSRPPEQNGFSAPQATPSTSKAADTAIAAFSDRLTALESALGLPSLSAATTNTTPSILPTLNILTTQLTTLTTTLSPPTTRSSDIAPTTTNPSLDALQTRIRALTHEASQLTTARRTALTSLSDLHDARARFAQTRNNNNAASREAAPTSTAPGATKPGAAQNDETREAGIHNDLFLSEQSSKITALYALLPSLTELQPLLPITLERLRSLSVIHAGAAEARGELDDVLRRQGEVEEEVKRWRDAVEGVERKMEEVKEEMGRNVEVLGEMVRGVEGKVEGLRKG